mmetsp:Transcript_13402/g.17481  ORF Transcript_13402/g.17481 Transcript_13402/m.17481 type:complete len:237 (+) Transcript_13402:288-998(+)
MRILASSALPYFSARFNRFSISSLGNKGGSTASVVVVASFSVFCRLPFFSASVAIAAPPPFFLVGDFDGDETRAMPNRLARNCFFSSNAISSVILTGGTVLFLSTTGAAVAAGAVVVVVVAVASSADFSFSSSFTFTSAVAGVTAVADGAAVVVAVAVAGGAVAKPNSSSSNRACNRLIKSALSPSVDNPRFASSDLRSETFIFLVSISLIVCLNDNEEMNECGLQLPTRLTTLSE